MGNEKKVNLPDIIRDRKILPLETKKKIMDGIFYNCLLFMIMLIITLIINTLFDKISIKKFDSYIDIIQIICGLFSVAILEIAYRKGSGKVGIYGIEFLVFSIITLFVPYMYISKSNVELLKNSIVVFLIYYILKSIFTLIHTRNSYLSENMSDVKEIVKEEKESYIDEESTKTLKNQKIEAEKKKKLKEERLKKKLQKMEDQKND